MQRSPRAALLAAAKAKQVRTCCNCFHIKHGTVILGLLELVAITLILSGILKQVVSKHREMACNRDFLSRLFRACYQWSLSTFDWTLAGDYFITLLLLTIALCILLLFLGILKRSPFLLLPHLLIQGIFLLSSLAYFFLYAWSYFYIDLYEQRRSFQVLALLERMWLATLLLMLAACQLYVFFTVVKCCLYLQDQRNERLRRVRQFEECSKRVRDAKQNGLWRSTSWGGRFQQYIGEYDGQSRKARKRDRPAAHVQWDLQANREKTISIAGTDDQSESTLDLSARNAELGDEARSVSPKVSRGDSDRSDSRKHPPAGQPSATASLPTAVKEKYEKQFPKAVVIQPVQPITSTAADRRKVSNYDNASMTKCSQLERRSRSPEKDSLTRSYHSSVKRISISSTTPPLVAMPPAHLHSMLH